MRSLRNNRYGFSLIELLTVIAIIGILSAIIFPVMGAVRARARQTQCMTNMNEIQRALHLYKNDNGRYPPVLSGFAETGVPFDSMRSGYLFARDYVSAATSFGCPDSTRNDPTVTVPDPFNGIPGRPTIGLDRPAGAHLYAYSSYDVQVLNYDGVPMPRYTLSWADTEADVPLTDPAAREDAFMRQLKFRNPPGNTVVTWCSYHRGGTQEPGRGHDLVLFLDGHVDRMPSGDVQPGGAPWNYPYTVKPKLGG